MEPLDPGPDWFVKNEDLTPLTLIAPIDPIDPIAPPIAPHCLTPRPSRLAPAGLQGGGEQGRHCQAGFDPHLEAQPRYPLAGKGI